jgi:uncharacterized membrane protein
VESNDYLIDLQDAVFAVKDKAGKVKVHQPVNLTAAGALQGGFWGALLGLLFLNPLLGMAVGATAARSPAHSLNWASRTTS